MNLDDVSTASVTFTKWFITSIKHSKEKKANPSLAFMKSSVWFS